jgi:predicted methyltransferase
LTTNPRSRDQILFTLAHGGPARWGVLLDRQDGTLAEFCGALESLQSEGVIAVTDGVASLTAAGREAAAKRALGGAPVGLACGTCEAKGYRVAPDAPVLKRLERLLDGRPGPNFDFDQGAITPADALLRAAFMEERGDLHGRSILMIGDFDLMSIALAVAGRPARCFVLDIDERIIDFVNTTARREGLPLEARRFDVRGDLPDDLHGAFDSFICDPVETLPGIRLYLSRGATGLRGEGSAAYVGLTTLEASRRKWRDIQSVLLEMGFGVTDVRRRFSGYPDHDEAPSDDTYSYPIIEAMGASGVEHRWYTSAFIRAEAVEALRPAVRGPVELGPELYVDDEAWATPRAVSR